VNPPLANRPISPQEARPEHRQVDRAFIGGLVREFYRRVRANERLGPIFAGVIGEDWQPHLATMTDFWCSVILRDGTYDGRPVPAHLKLKQVVESDFELWLRIFRQTAADLCDPPVAVVFVDRAERIAQSLKLAMFPRLPVVRSTKEV